MRALLTGLLLLAATVPAAAFNFDSTPGRLPKTIVPTDYTISLVPNVAAQTFTGTESVKLNVRKPTNRVVFNTLNMTLSGVRVDGRAVAHIITDAGRQITTLVLPRALPAGTHVMTLAFAGKMNPSPEGMFERSYRTHTGNSGVMLSTQLESTAARRLFPCWDEPAFKATYALSATIPSAWVAIGNMPVTRRVSNGATTTFTFARTPKMSTYLVELTAGDYRSISEMHNGIRYSVWAVRGDESEGRAALKNSEEILDDYNAYYGFRYPLPKLDTIAIPGGFPGAMENWGAITYNAQFLLMGPNTNVTERELPFDFQAHEMSHQWTGDLETLDWWSDVFVNEGFAAWMERKETALRNPSWQWWEIRDGDKQGAFDVDSQLTSTAIISPVKNELEAEANFNGSIEYDKAANVLRMFEEYLTPEVFRDGIRRFVREHAYSNANGTDFWKAMSEATGKDMVSIGGPWINQPGFPVVTVQAQCDSSGKRTLTLDQHRFLLAGTESTNARWSVPLQIRSGDGPTQRFMLQIDGQNVGAGTCDQPLTVNAGGYGFYRVSYDAQTLATNTKAFASFPDPDKIAMLGDEWAFARSGAADLNPYLNLAANMGSDLDARAWEQIVASFSTLEQDERGLPNHDAFAQRARTIVRPVFDRLGWSKKPGEAPPTADLRSKVITALGQWGDPAVIGEARRRFALFVRNRAALSPDQQDIILPIVAQYADAATFAKLHAIARSATDAEQFEHYYGALLSVHDPRLARMALQALFTDRVPPQVRTERAFVMFRAVDQNPRLTWEFFKAHFKELAAAGPSMDFALFMAQGLPTTFAGKVPLDEIAAWLKANTPPEAAIYVKRGLQDARNMLAEKTRLEADVSAELARTP